MADKSAAQGNLGDLKAVTKELKKIDKTLGQIAKSISKIQTKGGISSPSTTGTGTTASPMAQGTQNGFSGQTVAQRMGGGGGAGGGGSPMAGLGVGAYNAFAGASNRLGQYAPDWTQMDYTARMYTRSHGGSYDQNISQWFGSAAGPGALKTWGTQDRTQAMATAEFMRGGIQGAATLGGIQQSISPAAGAADVTMAGLQMQSPASEWTRVRMGMGIGNSFQSNLKASKGNYSQAMISTVEKVMKNRWQGRTPTADQLMAATRPGAALGQYMSRLAPEEAETTMQIIRSEASVLRKTGQTIEDLGGLESEKVQDIVGEDAAKMLASGARDVETGRADRAGIMGIEGGIAALQTSMEALSSTIGAVNEHGAGLLGLGGAIGGATAPWARTVNMLTGGILGLGAEGAGSTGGGGMSGLTFTSGSAFGAYSEAGALASLNTATMASQRMGTGGGSNGATTGGDTGGGTNGAGPAPSGGSSGATGSNARWIFQSLLGAGFTKQAAAGVIGNLVQESGVNPLSKQSGGPGRGLMQWTESGRWKSLNQWASGSGKDPWSLQTQYEWMVKEMKDYGVWASLAAEDDVHEAALLFEQKMERAGKPNMAARYKNADSAYSAFASQSGQQRNIGGRVDQDSEVRVHQGEMVLAKASGADTRSSHITFGPNSINLNIASTSDADVRSAVDRFVRLLSAHPSLSSLGG